MRLLVLGGTRFSGRAIVELLAAGGHDVTCFHRGTSRSDLPDGVGEVFGDRNDALPAELHAQAWDAVIDTSGQLPAQVARSVELPAARYVFISTLSVYADDSRPGMDEDAATIDTFDPNDAAAAYGGNKAACERILVERFGDRAAILRPGLIVGPRDYSGRFSYWPARALRGGRFAAPAQPDYAVQFVDAGDLADFAVLAAVNGIGGTYNVVGPAETYTIGELLAACVAAAAERGVRSEPVYVDGGAIVAAGAEPWTDVPMWIPDDAYAGFFRVSNRKAIAAGLRFRSPNHTIRALLDWLETPEAAAAARPGLSPELEAKILANP
jgi:2'-hydroxyisoflavone reductase